MSNDALKAHALMTSSQSAALDAKASQLLAAKVEKELNRFQDAEKVDFISALEQHGNVHKACTLCGISRASALQARHKDPLFADAWHAALESHIDDVEEAMLTRAKDPSSANTVAGIFVLKSRRRDQYAETLQVDHNVKGRVDFVVDLVNAPKGDVVDAEFVDSLGEAESNES